MKLRSSMLRNAAAGVPDASLDLACERDSTRKKWNESQYFRLVNVTTLSTLVAVAIQSPIQDGVSIKRWRRPDRDDCHFNENLASVSNCGLDRLQV
jgi:hypothetical protein